MGIIGIVILNYNTYEDTIKLVGDLQKQTVADDLCIVVVDNASPNGSFAYLKPLEEQYDNVTVIYSEQNNGYAQGNNIGLKYLEENVSPEYVAILNNDVILPDNSFERLVVKYKELERSAVIAPMMLNTEGVRMIPSRMNTFFDDFIHMLPLLKYLPSRNSQKEKDNTGMAAMRTDMIPGSFMFVSFPIFKQIGYFYPNTFLYVEERFITVRVRELGLNNYVLLDETYIHAHSKSIDTTYGKVAKYKLLYDGWLEFTRVCRKHGKVKAAILKPLSKYSLWEIKVVSRLSAFMRPGKKL